MVVRIVESFFFYLLYPWLRALVLEAYLLYSSSEQYEIYLNKINRTNNNHSQQEISIILYLQFLKFHVLEYYILAIKKKLLKILFLPFMALEHIDLIESRKSLKVAQEKE
jgi:hypothetical protein